MLFCLYINQLRYYRQTYIVILFNKNGNAHALRPPVYVKLCLLQYFYCGKEIANNLKHSMKFSFKVKPTKNILKKNMNFDGFKFNSSKK